jgi:ABC-2 type transport system ATP-binding protein
LDEIISTYNLTKVYPNGTRALQNINIRCKGGQLYCLVGENGAGKTTLLRILTTQLLLTDGECYVMGFDVMKEADKVRKHIAIVPQDASPVSSMSVWQHVYWYLVSRGQSFAQAKIDAKNALKLLNLWDLKDKYPGMLSGGQKKRIIVAMALATNADVLFLDEPTAGLDPIAKKDVWGSLRERVANGHTIFLTTHDMEEAEMLSDNLIMINKGKIVASGTLSELRMLLEHRFKVILRGVKGIEGTKFERYGEILTIGDRLVIYPINEEKLKQLVADASARGFMVEVRPTSLEDVFTKLLGEKHEMAY